jgi:hypothetical protein
MAQAISEGAGGLRKTIQRYVQVGRHQAFRRFWLGMMISRAGDAFTVVALSWLVLDIAGPLQLGVVPMCFGLPRVVSGPVAGRVLDRSDPRLLMAEDNAARGLLIAVVPALLWLHRLVAVAAVGAGSALLLDAISFAVMSALCLRLPAFSPVKRPNRPSRSGRPNRPGRPGPPARSERAARRDWLGLGLLFRFPAAAVLTACSVGMLCLDGIATVLYPVYCRTFLHISAAGYGALVSAAGLGALFGVVAGTGLFGRLPTWSRVGAVIASGAPLFGLLRVAPDLPVAAILLGLATFGWGPYFALDRTLMQRLVPDDLRGRLAGARMAISSAGFPLGSVIGGALIGAIGVPAMILAIAGSYLALGLLPVLTAGLRAYPGAGPVARAGQNAE